MKMVYINDFSKDLSEKKVIFYLGCVDDEMLYSKLVKDGVIGRKERGIYLQYVLDNDLMFIKSGKISDVDTTYTDMDNSFSTLMKNGYIIIPLQYDPHKQKYFVSLGDNLVNSLETVSRKDKRRAFEGIDDGSKVQHSMANIIEGSDISYENSGNKLDPIRP